MPQIKAQDEIAISASVDDVWKVLTDIPRYQDWWPRVVNLQVLKINEEIIGTEFQASPLGGKSFSCKVLHIILNKEIRLDYFDGIYRGEGVWNIEAREDSVKVSYTVDLEIVDKQISFLSRIIPIPKLHSMIFKKILGGLEKEVNTKI